MGGAQAYLSSNRARRWGILSEAYRIALRVWAWENGKSEFREMRRILAFLAAPCKDLYIREEDVYGTGWWEKGRG